MWIGRLPRYRRSLVSQGGSSFMRQMKSLFLSGFKVLNFSMLWSMLYLTLSRMSFDMMWTVKDNFGVLLKFIDLTEMSRDTLKSHCKGLERNLLSTLKTDISKSDCGHLKPSSSPMIRATQCLSRFHGVTGVVARRIGICQKCCITYCSFCWLRIFPSLNV